MRKAEYSSRNESDEGGTRFAVQKFAKFGISLFTQMVGGHYGRSSDALSWFRQQWLLPRKVIPEYPGELNSEFVGTYALRML